MSTVTVKTAVERYDFEDYGTLEESGRYVKFEDYAALAAQRVALAAENAVRSEFIAHCFRVAADGGTLDGGDIQELGERLALFGRETYQPILHGYICGHEAGEDTVYVMKKNPATDAFLREVRAQARSEGINYAASRLAAAFDHGFVDKPVKEVADVVRMILTAKDELANDPLPAPDALSGEYAEQALEEWATELRQGGAQSTTDEIPLPVERELMMALRKGGAA
ncbi:hypothetical protein MT962_000628 [Franconibacter sp. IITDAS19]|uniref:hypothetical protein n=1 Tax=Franconibacter sp. IITDAS19 TaxID=2930569 RepID=UPI001FF70727|nr:hypothetical protein [Franconibacter sp. IITDAS19]MCK1966842.1 hypothetical protein [Franconibacter sp. IITDAS19]